MTQPRYSLVTQSSQLLIWDSLKRVGVRTFPVSKRADAEDLVEQMNEGGT